MIDLQGRVVLVTGGNGGIGLGMAEGCAMAGASVVVWGTNPTKLDSAEAKLRDLGAEVLAARVDVSDEEQVVTSMAAAVEQFGRIDAAFANAGVANDAPFLEQTAATWRECMAVNLDGAFFTFREAARHMVERGEGGSLVGVSSTSAIHGAPGAQPYAASKAAMLAMVRGLAVEFARYGIRANSVIPGWTETDMTEGAKENEKFLSSTIRRTPIRRWGTPDDFRAVGAFLADPTQVFHTGDEIVLDGGYTRF